MLIVDIAGRHNPAADREEIGGSPVPLVHALAQPQLDSGRLAFETRMVQRARQRNLASQSTQRLFDVTLAGLMLMATAPLMLLIAAAIRLTSPGPVFFHQTRVGRWGRPFACLKFRTMVIDAEQQLAHILTTDPHARAAFQNDFKLAHDPRITPIGRLLRKTSLDELPQLINVLRGDMSLVGPRPVVPQELGRYGDYAQVVLQVRPGITGAWQTNGRNNISYAQRVQLDVHYALNRNLKTDITILARTLNTVLNPQPGESR